MTIQVGISTCPNDTFAFAALLEGRVEGAPSLEFRLDDIEALNEALMRRELPVSKASFHAALHLAKDYRVLSVGAALGHGVGPLLLCGPSGADRLPRPGDRVLCPGRFTTASLLYRLYCRDGPEARQLNFAGIMPALGRGEADFGVVIHEGRFTYREHGLALVRDLGELWAEDSGAALPLGGILARRDLEEAPEIARAIQTSLEIARKEPSSALRQMRVHAQELSGDVLWQHVKLYVNEATMELGEEGRRALRLLEERALRAGVVDSPRTLEVLEK